MKKIQLMTSIIALLPFLFSCQAPKEISVVPLPVSVQQSEGAFKINKKLNFSVAANEEIQRIADGLNQELSQVAGISFTVGEQNAKRNIVLELDETVLPEHAEGYTISVSENQILLRANSPAGLFYARKTLLQMVQPGTFGLQIPVCEIQDYPRFSYRGTMLDVSRHFFGPEEVKHYIDLIADIKINMLHLHLSDDQGWRIEIKSWPELTKTGANCEVGEGPVTEETGGFYTQEEFKDLIAYAAERYITIIPEIDMPGHTNAALSSYAELNKDGKKTEPYRGIEVGFSTLDTDKEITYQFVDDVVREISAISPGPYFHIGGDESHSTEKDDFIKFMNRVKQIVSKYDKRLIGWEESANADIDNRDIVQMWKGRDNAAVAIEKGAKVLASPADYCYLDMQYDSTSRIGLHWMGYVELDKAYNWDPAELLPNAKEEDIIGVESPLWTETVETVDDIEYLVFPRLVGHAEIGWSPKESRSWEGYQSRLVNYASRLEAAGVDFYRSPLVQWK